MFNIFDFPKSSRDIILISAKRNSPLFISHYILWVPRKMSKIILVYSKFDKIFFAKSPLWYSLIGLVILLLLLGTLWEAKTSSNLYLSHHWKLFVSKFVLISLKIIEILKDENQKKNHLIKKSKPHSRYLL